jgi:hypothetical protein
MFNILVPLILMTMNIDCDSISSFVDGNEACLNKLYHAIWSSAFGRCPLESDANVPLQIQVTKQGYASSLERCCSPDHNRYVNISNSIPTLRSAFIFWMTLTRGTLKFFSKPVTATNVGAYCPLFPATEFIEAYFKFSTIN